MERPYDDSSDDEIHPAYDVNAQIEELFSVPAYRHPPHPIIESWREIGERLLALGERHLLEGVDAASAFLQAKLDARPRRRRRRRVAKRRTVPAATAGAAAAATAGAPAAARQRGAASRARVRAPSAARRGGPEASGSAPSAQAGS